MKKKKIVLFVFLFVGVLSLILTYKLKQNNLNKNKPVKEEKLSIMIKEQGATDYTKSSSKDIPKGSYTLNTDKSYCKNNGKIEGYDSATGTVSFAFIGTDRCFLYFDEIVPPLYNIIENRYNRDDEFVKLYNGADYGDTTAYANNIYYFNGAVENNNVLFADKCWKIVRTTDTGGVKIVYSGRPTTDDYTLLSQSEYTNLTNDTSYPYAFDETNKTWTSTNPVGNNSTISFTVPSNGNYVLNYDLSMDDYIYYINVEIFKDDVSQGKYTGVATGQIVFKDLATSNVVKLVYTRQTPPLYDGNRNNVIFSFGKANSIIKTCNNTGQNSQIGTSQFNSSSNSPAYVGYMYNESKVYPSSSKTIINNTYFSGVKAYANAVTYDSSTQKYTLTNATTLNVTDSNISTLVGKYTCNSSSTTGTCYYLWYIAGYSGTTIYYYSLTDGTTDVTTLANQDYVFGNSFTYANGSYSLSNTVTINSDTFIANKSNINTHHYTCLTNGNSCTSIYYVYYIYNGTPYYITLTGGKSVSDALNEMLYADDVNTKDSTIKAYIDSWYEKNIKDKYEDKLEDTVFCNDRSISSLGGWNPDGGSTTLLQFKNYSTSNKSLECINETDRFSVNNAKAKLKYPIGLLTVPELSLANYGSGHYFNSGETVWLGSPNRFDGSTAGVLVVQWSGLHYGFVGSSDGVRPAVSIKPGTTISSGDGTYTNPFVIE